MNNTKTITLITVIGGKTYYSGRKVENRINVNEGVCLYFRCCHRQWYCLWCRKWLCRQCRWHCCRHCHCRLHRQLCRLHDLNCCHRLCVFFVVCVVFVQKNNNQRVLSWNSGRVRTGMASCGLGQEELAYRTMKDRAVKRYNSVTFLPHRVAGREGWCHNCDSWCIRLSVLAMTAAGRSMLAWTFYPDLKSTTGKTIRNDRTTNDTMDRHDNAYKV